MSDKKRVNTVNKALYKEPLLFGCDRTLFLSLILFYVLICYCTSSILVISLSSLALGIFIICLREMAKNDIFLLKVYLKALTYKDFYLARSSVNLNKK